MRWGLIGTRGYAAKSAAPGIRASKRGNLVAILGRDTDSTRTFAQANGATGFTDLDAFLEAGLDAVWITSPTFLHHEQTLAALHGGMHVLCEKPLARSASEAWQMVDAARAATRVLATGYQGRYVPGHQRMAELIGKGAIGDVTIARTYYGVHRPGPPPQWRQLRAQAGWGALADIGTHHLDLLRMLVGEISEARALVGHQLGFETEDAAGAALSFESGAIGTLAITVNVWKQQTRVEIHGTRGLLVATDTNPAGEGQVVMFDELHPAGTDVTGTRASSVWAAQVDAVTAAAGGEEVAYATGADGARNVEILESLSSSGIK